MSNTEFEVTINKPKFEVGEPVWIVAEFYDHQKFKWGLRRDKVLNIHFDFGLQDWYYTLESTNNAEILTDYFRESKNMFKDYNDAVNKLIEEVEKRRDEK